MSEHTTWPTTGQEPPHRKRVSFDPTINLGHVLTAVTFLAAGFAAWNALDKRVATMEVEQRVVREAQVQRDQEQDLRLRESVITIKETIQRVERGLETRK